MTETKYQGNGQDSDRDQDVCKTQMETQTNARARSAMESELTLASAQTSRSHSLHVGWKGGPRPDLEPREAVESEAMLTRMRRAFLDSRSEFRTSRALPCLSGGLMLCLTNVAIDSFIITIYIQILKY